MRFGGEGLGEAVAPAHRVRHTVCDAMWRGDERLDGREGVEGCDVLCSGEPRLSGTQP